MRVGILGGTFDPVHRGHLKLAQAALSQLRLDRVYFVVSPRSPFKIGSRRAPARTRLELVRLAIRGRRRLSAVDWEFRRRGPSYTVATLRAYRRRHPKDPLFLILGTDALAGFPRWKRPREIAGIATIVAGRRPGAHWPRLPSSISKGVRRLRGIFPDVSSTELRRKIASGKRPAELDPAVYRRIIERRTYR